MKCVKKTYVLTYGIKAHESVYTMYTAANTLWSFL